MTCCSDFLNIQLGDKLVLKEEVMSWTKWKIWPNQLQGSSRGD
jgi:hypothetical protein